MLYPTYNDEHFQRKISSKKELQFKINPNNSCDKKNIYILEPQQQFVSKFLSPNNPYNGLLLYHGLGSGKTCSAISIANEFRKFYEYHPNYNKIIVVASPNVIQNFKLQLFDENNLIKKKNKWTLNSCIGQQLLNQIPNTHELDKKILINKIKKIIKQNFVFTGYLEFANKIHNSIKQNNKAIKEFFRKKFENCSIIIDEAHNIRSNSHDDKKVYNAFELLFKWGPTVKLVLLTGTPIFNEIDEIYYIVSLLYKNDKRKPIEYNQIFNNNIELINENNLRKFLNGYVSYVRGDNPNTFPHLIFPKDFDPNHSHNDNSIIDIYYSKMNTYQYKIYNDYCSKNIKKLSDLNFTTMTKPLQILNIVYPTDSGYLLSDEGFNYHFTKINSTVKYKYKKDNIFSENNIGNYSIKIKQILNSIKDSVGIVLVYSQYIYSGIIPLAIALEEAGYDRYASKNLIKKIILN